MEFEIELLSYGVLDLSSLDYIFLQKNVRRT